MSEEKFSKCEEREKMFKCRISGVRKKKKVKEKFGEKILGKILLSSYSLGKFLLICKLKFQRKKMETFKVFCG